MKIDLYKQTTDRILAKLAEGVVPWRKPWRSYGSGAMPRNAITNRPYSGANVVLTWITAEERGYTSPLWLTHKQALEASGGEGGVRKGEKGTHVLFWGSYRKPGEDDSEPAKVAMFLKSYTVFNVAQCDGLDHLIDRKPRIVNPGVRDMLADEFVRSTGADVRHGESRAYYAANGDYVNLPAFEAFTGSEEYYSVLFHELTHWSGAEHRLNRTFGKRFGDAAYSAEELVAELGSAFLCAEFGFDNQTLDNSAAYIDHWSSFLKQNDRAFIAAASAASKATEFMRNLAMQAEPVPVAA
jgi:antirestriction protein ArdC